MESDDENERIASAERKGVSDVCRSTDSWTNFIAYCPAMLGISAAVTAATSTSKGVVNERPLLSAELIEPLSPVEESPILGAAAVEDDDAITIAHPAAELHDSTLGPEHAAPPSDGAGLVHELLRWNRQR